MMELTIAEQAELTKHETVIAGGLKVFVAVGLSLLAIRDGRLYRQEHGTFEAYCQERWNITPRHGRRLIDAAEVVNNLGPIGPILPQVESQARPLAQLEPAQQIEAWQRAVKTAPEGKITAAHVQQVVDTFRATPVHVAQATGNNEWYTPPEYTEAARRVMGGIDLDPASSEIANRIVGANTFYTIQNDGLLWEWRGRVWMNPPYAQPLIGQFAAKLAGHVKWGHVSEACVLVNNATETGWFSTMLDIASCVCFIRGRVRFIDERGNPSGAPLQGQAVLYIGPNSEAFASEFSKFGTVLYAR